ncbi:hypothetical protein, partial [Pseudomonas aeruginosa]
AAQQQVVEMQHHFRLGLLLPGGGAAYLPRIRALCQARLGWDDPRWEREQQAYLDLWRRPYSLPV